MKFQNFLMLFGLSTILLACSDNSPESPNNGTDNEVVESSNLVKSLKAKAWTTSSKDYSWNVEDNPYFDEDKYYTRMFFFDNGHGVCLNRQLTHEYIEGNISISRDLEWFSYTEESANEICIIPEDYNLSRSRFKLQDNKLIDPSTNQVAFNSEGFQDSDQLFMSYYAPAMGKCGQNVSYSYEPWRGALKIEGSGEMFDFSSANDQPWRKFRSIGDIDIDGSVTHIGNYAFAEIADLSWVENSTGSIKSYGAHCFERCLNLTRIPSMNKVEHIGASAFRDCKSFKNILSDDDLASLVSIDDAAFLGVKETSIHNLKMGAGLTTIGSAAFGENKGSTVILNDGLRSISNQNSGEGVSTFGLYGSKIKLELPSTVEVVGMYSFSGDINEIHLGANVKTVSECAFITSQSSGNIYIDAKTPPSCADNIIAEPNQWKSLHSKWTLHVPEGSEGDYRNAAGWNKFKITGSGSNTPDDPDDEDNHAYWANHPNRGAVSTSWKGKGTQSDPYLIQSAADLRLLSDKVRGRESMSNKYFKQTSDITINRKVLNASGNVGVSTSTLEQWIPIGVYSTKYQSFQGNYDGGGYSISGIYIDRDIRVAGLFGYAGGGKISNVVVKDSYIKCNSVSGGIIGWNLKLSNSSGSYLTQCTNYATVVGVITGGIIGRAQYKQVVRCINYGTVRGINSDARCGGIVGDKLRASTDVYGELMRCINYGNIEASAGGIYGGIIGYGSRVNDCLNAGGISGTATIVGGIVGIFDGSIHGTGCNNNVVTGTIDCPSASYAGIIMGRDSKTGGQSMKLRYNRMLKVSSLEIYGKSDYCQRYDNLIVTKTEMKSPEMIKTLNKNSTGKGTVWTTGKDGYPCPTW